MRLSIIVPVYNRELSIERCINSITKQSFDDYECIIIDDGSSDSTLTICEKLACETNKIKVVHTDNHGVSRARNVGVDNAQGDYITFVDSDDYIDCDTYEKCMKIADKSDVICYGMKMVRDNKSSNIPFNHTDIESDFINYPKYMNSVCNKIFSRQLIHNNSLRFLEDVHLCEDMLFSFMAMSLAKTVGYIEDNMYYYVDNSESATSEVFTLDSLEELRIVNECLEQFIQQQSINNSSYTYMEYRRLNFAMKYLLCKECYNPQKYIEYNSLKRVWKYNGRYDLMILSMLANKHIFWPSLLYSSLKG